jgi:hypothetical protein
MNGNGIPEIGVLHINAGQPAVYIKDAMNNSAYLHTWKFLTGAYDPLEIAAIPDSNRLVPSAFHDSNTSLT